MIREFIDIQLTLDVENRVKKSLEALEFKDSKAFLFFQPLEKQGKA